MELAFTHKIIGNKKLMQLARFALSGFVGLLIDFFFTWLCKEYFGLNKYLSNGIGFSMAVINNYILNRIWTFKNKEAAIAKQFIIFLSVSIIGLLISTSFLFLIHQKLNVNFYISKALVVLIVFVWNYTANSKLTFKKH
ncbi:MAG: GtrA family protein [Chitinophagaceae bacterium]|nr:GtrA family protein [Chitinophagaceae bacterium]